MNGRKEPNTERPAMPVTKGLGERSGPTRGWAGVAIAVGIVAVMLMGGFSGLGTMLPSAVGPVHTGVAKSPGGAAALSGGSSAGLTIASEPYGQCGASTWCPAVSASANFYTSTSIALPTLSARTCSVPLSAGVCQASASFTGSTSTYVQPAMNASNDASMNETSSGELVMAYTSYTTGAPTGAGTCIPARPTPTSEIAFTETSGLGSTWSTPILLGNPDCGSVKAYPSAWDPAITSLKNGTLVLAYVEYNASAPNLPPELNPASPPVSRLVVTESYTGGTSWSVPTVINVSRPDPSLTVAFAPARPSITAYGNTIYLTWMSLGSIANPAVVSHVAMVLSTTGGKSWSPTITLGQGYSYSANPNVLVDPQNGELFIAYLTNIGYCNYFGDNFNAYAYCAAPSADGTPYSGDVVVASSTYNGTSFTTNYVDFGMYLNQTFGPFVNPAPQLSWGSTNGVLDVAFVAGVSTTGVVNGFPYPYASITPTLFFFSSPDLGGYFQESYSDNTAFIEPSILWGGLANSTQLLDIAMTPKFAANVGLEATVFNGSACLSGSCGAVLTQAVNSSDNGTSWSSPWILSGAIATNGTNGSWKAFLTGTQESTLLVGSTFLYAWEATSCPSWNLKLTPAQLGQCGSFTGLGGAPKWTLWGTTNVELSTVSTASGVSETFTAAQTVPANDTWGLDLMGGYYEANGSANITITNIPLSAPLLFNGSAPGLWANGSSLYQGGKASVSVPYTFTAASTPLVTLTFIELVPLTVDLAPSWLAGPNCLVSYDGFCPLYTPPPGPSPNDLNPYNCQGTYCYNPPAGATSNNAGDLGCSAYIYYENIGDEIFGDFYGNGCINAFVQGSLGTSVSANPTNITYGAVTWLPVGQAYTLSPAYWSPLNTLCDANGATPIPTSLFAYSFWFFELYCDENYFLELTPQAWLGNGTGSVTSTQTVITLTPSAAVTETIDWNISGWCAGSYTYGYEEGSYTTITYSGAYNYTTCQSGNPLLNSVSGGAPVPLKVTETGLPKGTAWGLQLTSGANVYNQTTKSTSMTFELPSGSTYAVNALTIPIPGSSDYWFGTTNATVTMPDFVGITVTFTKQLLTGYVFPGTVRESGLPNGTAWDLALTDEATSTTTSLSLPPGPTASLPLSFALQGGVSYGLNGSTVSMSNGTEYYVSAVNVTVDSINSTPSYLPPWKQTFDATGPTTATLVYSPSYYVTVEGTAGGTIAGVSQFVNSGKSLNLTAKALTNYTFVGWVGSGSGSVNSKLLTITVRPNAAVTEFAVFRDNLAPTWTLSIQATGIPVGQNYSVTIDGVTHSGVGAFNVTNITSGDHLFSAPMTYSEPSVTTRYVSTGISTSSGPVSGPVFIGANELVTVTFAPEYLLTLTTTTGGTIGGASNGAWLSPGTPETLTATASADYHFVSWNGTGLGSYSGNLSTASVTVNSPITELAQFVVNPIPPTPRYEIAVTETGLPANAAWNATLGVVGQSGSGSTLTMVGLTNGSYTLSVPTVYGSAGVRYVPNGLTVYTTPETVSGADVSATVTFATQYLLTVEVAGNGTVTPSTGWQPAGASVSPTATPNATLPGATPWKFANWTSVTSGVANESGSTYTGLSMNGPVTLTATFVPQYTQKSTTVVLAGAPVAFGLLVLLLLVGLVAAYVMSRRRGSNGPAGSESGRTVDSASPKADEASEDAMGGSGDQAEWAEPPPPGDVNGDGTPD